MCKGQVYTSENYLWKEQTPGQLHEPYDERLQIRLSGIEAHILWSAARQLLRLL